MWSGLTAANSWQEYMELKERSKQVEGDTRKNLYESCNKVAGVLSILEKQLHIDELWAEGKDNVQIDALLLLQYQAVVMLIGVFQELEFVRVELRLQRLWNESKGTPMLDRLVR